MGCAADADLGFSWYDGMQGWGWRGMSATAGLHGNLHTCRSARNASCRSTRAYVSAGGEFKSDKVLIISNSDRLLLHHLPAGAPCQRRGCK